MRSENTVYIGLKSFRERWHIYNYIMSEIYKAEVCGEATVLVVCPSEHIEKLENQLRDEGYKVRQQDGQLLIERQTRGEFYVF